MKKAFTQKTLTMLLGVLIFVSPTIAVAKPTPVIQVSELQQSGLTYALGEGNLQVLDIRSMNTQEMQETEGAVWWIPVIYYMLKHKTPVKVDCEAGCDMNADHKNGTFSYKTTVKVSISVN